MVIRIQHDDELIELRARNIAAHRLGRGLRSFRGSGGLRLATTGNEELGFIGQTHRSAQGGESFHEGERDFQGGGGGDDFHIRECTFEIGLVKQIYSLDVKSK